MKIKIILCFVIISSIIYAANLPVELKLLSRSAELEAYAKSDLVCLVKSDKVWETDLIISGNITAAQLPVEAHHIRTYNNFILFRLPVNQLLELEKIMGIKYIYASLKSKMLLDISTSNAMNGSNYTGCDADYIQNHLTAGENVIVGLIDPYQLNWQHEDFGNDQGSRIISIWDQQGSGGNTPLIYDYGTEYTSVNLDSGNGPAINTGQHHGTQCAGIAAGDGSASGGAKAGMLPASEIIYVRQEAGSASLIDAISYIAYKAGESGGGNPVVISMSVGAMFGHPDGSDPVAQVLTDFGSAGRISCVAAGNWYNYDCFATGSAQYGNPVNDFSFTINGSNTGGNDFVISRLYYNLGDDFAVYLTAPDMGITGNVNPGSDEIFDTEFGKVYIFHEQTELGNPYLEIVISDEYGIITAGDEWVINLEVPQENLDDAGGWWWGWIAGVGYNAEYNNYYQGAYSLNTYACGAKTLCVGAHDKNSGALYSSCSSGAPNEVVKPELSAPTNASAPNAASTTGYSSLCCTSGAAPHAAGAAGLILARESTLQPQEVMYRLQQEAFIDGQTGEVPSNRWGWGKLNSKAAFLQYWRGDVDNNGEIDCFDSSLILMLNAGINYFEETDPLPWEDWRVLWSDVDGNGEIEAYDASLILQYIVELINQLPALN